MSVNNHATFIGNIGKDPDFRYTPKGTALLTFSVAVNCGQDKTLWVSCSIFGKSAETAREYLKKGMQVGVEGRLDPYEFQGQDGVTRKGFNLVVNDWRMLEKRSRPAAEQEASEYVDEPVAEDVAPF